MVPHGVADEPTSWRKSSYSNPSGECVQVGELARDRIAVRNSREPAAGSLIFTRVEMSAFVAGLKDGEFDELTRSSGA